MLLTAQERRSSGPDPRSTLVGRGDGARKFAVELLEERLLLTGPAFAIVEGVFPASGGAVAITIQVSKQVFTLDRSGHVVLEALATANGGAPLSVESPVGAIRGTVGHESAAGDGWQIASLAPGQFTFSIARGTPGASFTVDLSLVGDVNGNGIVDRQDIRAIRSRLGVSVKSDRYLPGANPFDKNRIGMADLLFSLSDLHAGTTLVPLSLSLSDVQPTATNPLADVVVQSGPDTSITLTDLGAVQTGQTDSAGQASFAAGLLTGQNTFQVVATDSFGQRVDATETVTRGTLSNYLESVFGPYVGQWIGTPPNAMPPLYNSSGSGNSSVANQISLVATQFSSIATYGAGYASYYTPTTPYNQVDSNWMVGGAAAAYNQSQSALKLTVSQGIYQQLQPMSENFNLPLMDAEANGAISIAKAANAIYPGTVTRLIFTNEFVTDATTTNEVENLITQPQGGAPSYLAQAHAHGLEVGVRSNTFGQLTDPSSPYLVPLQNLVKKRRLHHVKPVSDQRGDREPCAGRGGRRSAVHGDPSCGTALEPNDRRLDRRDRLGLTGRELQRHRGRPAVGPG